MKKFHKNPNGKLFLFKKSEYSTAIAAVQALMNAISLKYRNGPVRLVKKHTETHWGLLYERVTQAHYDQVKVQAKAPTKTILIKDDNKTQ